MRPATALDAIHRHPRHTVLFAATTGLLLGPLSPAATLLAALATATLVLTATRAGSAPLSDEASDPPAAPAPPEPPPAPAPHGSSPGPAARDSPPGAAARKLSAGPAADAVPLESFGPAAREPSSGGAAVVAALAAAAVLLGAVIADLRIAALDGSRLRALHGQPVAGRAVVLEPVRERSWGPAVARARLIGGQADGEVAVLRVPPTLHPGAWPEVGDIVDITGKAAPLGRYDAYQRKRGAAAAVDVSRLRATGLRRGGMAGAVDSVRRRAEAGLSHGLSEPRAALLRGMVLGQDERLTETTRDDFERSGLAHILAVSGQNVMLLATLVLGAGALTGLGLRARLGLALALIALYVPLTGAGPSIQRAGVMGAAGLVAVLAGRPAHRWYALGLAAAVTLAANPLAAGDPGWQLSFVAVVALLALAPSLRGVLGRRMPQPLADVAAITIAATIGTAPLMALHFEQVSLAALPANLLAAAAIAPVMWLGMLAAAAAQIAPALAAPFNALNAPLLGFVEWVARTMAAAPHSTLPVRLGSPIALAISYGVLATAVLALRRRWAGRAEPGRPRRSPARVAAAAVVAAATLLLVAATETGDGSRPAPGELVVSFLDVGQGDATLLQYRGAAVLIDTGPPDGPILQRLEEAGVERLDALVITHAQADHEGAALTVMRKHPPRLVVNGGGGWQTAVQRHLPAAIAAARSRRVNPHQGDVLVLAGIRMRMLWPPPLPPSIRPDGDPNDRALVAHVEVGDFDLLMPADAETNVTAALDLPQVEALKVAHHGSADEGLPGMLERTDPAFAAIEVGEENTYGHPAPSTLQALRVVDEVVRTDRDGTVRLRVNGGEMRIERDP